MASAKKKISVSLAGAGTDALPESPELRRARRADPPSPELHINGQVIPAAFAHAVPYANTDEGVAERLLKTHATSSVTRGPYENSLQARRDFRKNEDDSDAAPDPMGDLARRYVPPGMRAKFLGPLSIDQKGMRGYEPVLNERGDPVTLGRMILGQIPEEAAQRRQRADEARGNRAGIDVQEKFHEEQERFQRSAAGRSGSAMGSSRDSDDGLHESRGNVDEVLR